MDAKGTPPPPPPNPNPSRRRRADSRGRAAASSASKQMLAFHFLRALARIHRAAPVPRRTRTIRAAAYSSMARAAGTRRAWSRALLRQARARRSRAGDTTTTTRRAVLVRRRVAAAAPAAPSSQPLPSAAAAMGSVIFAAGEASTTAAPLAAARQAGEPLRADALRRLVPGGAGMEYCSLLDETADYVRCLRAQVQLMQGLVDLFSYQ